MLATRTAIIDITQRLFLAGKKILKISIDDTAARSTDNLITEKAIKDYVDSVTGGDLNIDGGFPFSAYLAGQSINGGTP